MEEFLNLFLKSELSLLDFCKQYNLSRVEFEGYINDKGYYWKNGRSGIKVNLFKLAIDDYVNSLESVGASAKRFGINSQSLSKDLKELDLYDESRKGKSIKKYNERIFDTIDTEEKAYWLGFIFADGYIYSSPIEEKKSRTDWNFELCASGTDKEHMEKFAKFIGYTKELKITKADNKGNTRCRVCLSSQHLWETLNSYGCTPRKSLTLKFPSLNIFKDESLVWDFIRGYIDGDGCISYATKDHSKMLLSLLGTEDFLNSIQDVFSTKYTLEYNHNDKNSKTRVLEIACRPGLNILHKLYSHSKIYLKRKYERYLEYCRLYEESYRELETNNGEGCDVNPVISTESKESVPS